MLQNGENYYITGYGRRKRGCVGYIILKHAPNTGLKSEL